MEVNGDYDGLGYAHVKGLVPIEVARAFMVGLKRDLGPEPIELSSVTEHGPQLKRPAFQIYGAKYPPMSFFLWALTPTISRLIGRDLLPSYDYFRIYREGDVCLVHSDRPSCEHSVSLTLDYSDGEVWDLQVAHDRTLAPLQAAPDFGASEFSSVGMGIGDAVLYQGVHHRHGRVTPNPNGWSAHLFLHFVERGGPYEEFAFDKQLRPQPVNFSFV